MTDPVRAAMWCMFDSLPFMKSTAIAVIPARGGSKRVPRKNIRDLKGKPLIAFTIEAALESGCFAEVVVSTDDQGIAEISRRLGASVPFLRPAALADDWTPSSLVTLDALNRLDPGGQRLLSVAQLMPNCPLRTAVDVRESARTFLGSNAPAQISVTRFGWQNPWWAMKQGSGGRLDPLFPDAMKSRSQDLAALFCPTGAIWWTKAEVLRRAQTFYAEGVTGWEIGWEGGMDIDTEEDWLMMEVLFEVRERRRRMTAV